MIRYPNILTPRELNSLINRFPDLLDINTYIEPKYDGSNITIYNGQIKTRNLNEVPGFFHNGLRTSLGNRYEELLKLSKRYQVFLELGGTRNSPVGYTIPWSGEWDYRVFDLYDGERFLEPPEIEEILTRYGLKFVGYEKGPRLGEVVRFWKNLLREKYSVYEGFVVKMFPPEELVKKLGLTSNFVGVKFKHEYLRPRQRKRVLEDSEILGVINKVHLMVGNDIRDVRKVMPIIVELVRKESEKHKSVPPSTGKLYKLYQLYLSRL